MEIQKTMGQSKNTSLFGPNFKINSHSVRTIHRYLQHSQSQQHLQENPHQFPSLSSLNSPVDKRLMAKNLIRTTSSHLPESQAGIRQNFIGKTNSFEQFSRQDYLHEIDRLSRETEEQRIIISLQQELINKLMTKLEGDDRNVSQHHNSIYKEQEQENKLTKLAKVKELLESSLRSL